MNQKISKYKKSLVSDSTPGFKNEEADKIRRNAYNQDQNIGCQNLGDKTTPTFAHRFYTFQEVY